MADRRVHELARALYTGRIDRRDFVRGMAALGVSATATNLFLRGAAARQGDMATPNPEGLKPPVVAKPCEGDGCLWAGKSITVQVIDASVKVPVDEVREEFEAATGATLTVVGDPIEGAFTKLMDDATSGTNSYDGSMIAMQWLGELVEGSLVVPVDEYYGDTSGKFPSFDISTEPESMKQLRYYGGQMYVTPIDCDGQALYYRRDLLNDPEHAKAFEDEYGYALPVPPQTWEQLRDVAKYFNGKPNGIDGNPVSGMSLHLKVGGQGMFHFMSFAAPFVIGPDNPNLFWFDPETMDPLMDSPGHQRAMETLIDLIQFGPEAMMGWSLGESWDHFLRGEAALTFTWGDLGALAQQEGSAVKGKTGSAGMPGTDEYYDVKAGEWKKTDGVNKVGNTTGGSWSGVISKFSDAPECTYFLLALMATKEKSTVYAYRGWDGVDPGRISHYLPPNGTNSIDAPPFRRLFTSVPVRTIPHSSSSSTWYSKRALRFCAMLRGVFGSSGFATGRRG